MLSRRRLLGGFGTILWSRPASATGRPAETHNGGLSVRDRETIASYGEILVDGRGLTDDERTLLVRHIEETAAASGDMRDLYRAASRELDRLAGQRFSALALEKRRALVSAHRLDAAISRDETPRPSATTQAIRTRVMPDLIEGYWSSPAGWAAVGYTTFPGRCGDLARYTRPET